MQDDATPSRPREYCTSTQQITRVAARARQQADCACMTPPFRPTVHRQRSSQNTNQTRKQQRRTDVDTSSGSVGCQLTSRTRSWCSASARTISPVSTSYTAYSDTHVRNSAPLSTAARTNHLAVARAGIDVAAARRRRREMTADQRLNHTVPAVRLQRVVGRMCHTPWTLLVSSQKQNAKDCSQITYDTRPWRARSSGDSPTAGGWAAAGWARLRDTAYAGPTA